MWRTQLKTASVAIAIVVIGSGVASRGTIERAPTTRRQNEEEEEEEEEEKKEALNDDDDDNDEVVDDDNEDGKTSTRRGSMAVRDEI